MASTFLRFQNAEVFQIIDKHAYRALFGVPYRLYSASSKERKISTYFNYLDELHKLARSKNVKFYDLDRILYKLDQKDNGPLKNKS
jgi:thermostable 8-oxoguanine DNA glycosylase